MGTHLNHCRYVVVPQIVNNSDCIVLLSLSSLGQNATIKVHRAHRQQRGLGNGCDDALFFFLKKKLPLPGVVVHAFSPNT